MTVELYFPIAISYIAAYLLIAWLFSVSLILILVLMYRIIQRKKMAMVARAFLTFKADGYDWTMNRISQLADGLREENPEAFKEAQRYFRD